MDVFGVFASNPVPTSLAVLVALVCLAGWWWYVIPVLEENKKYRAAMETLRNENSELKDKANSNIGSHDESVKNAIYDIQQNLSKQSQDKSKGLEEINQKFTQIKELYESSKNNKDVDRELLELSRLIKQLQTSQNEIENDNKRNHEVLQRSVDDLSRQVQTINEKQSQIIGALLGMDRVNDRNRGI